MTTPADRVYGYLMAYKQASGGDSPSRREIRDALELSTVSLVTYYLDRLEAEGLIRIGRDGNAARRARLIEVVGATWTPPGGRA